MPSADRELHISCVEVEQSVPPPPPVVGGADQPHSCWGRRAAAAERRDLLMQGAPEDLFAEAMAQIGSVGAALPGMVNRLHAPLHDNCYLRPIQFAEKFGMRKSESTDNQCT